MKSSLNRCLQKKLEREFRVVYVWCTAGELHAEYVRRHAEHRNHAPHPRLGVMYMSNNTNNPQTEAQRKEREKSLELALANIEKQFGKGSIMRLGTQEAATRDVDSIPTGSLGVDLASGIGGLPRGRIVEIFGPESSGKTTLSLQCIAEGQKKGGVCAFIDAEHALDISYARKLGVKTDDMWVSQPDNGEQALEIADTLVRSGGVDLLVIDSVAALVPKAEIDGEMGDQLPGLQARLMSQALRKLTASISKSNTCVIFINQIRMKIGVMFGSPETTTGGNALKFYASMRFDIRRVGAIKQGEAVVGSRTRVKIVKNKMAAPFREAEFDIMYGEGVNKLGEIVDLGAEMGVIEKSGAWYSFEGTRIGQGRDNVCAYFRANPETAARVEQLIHAKNSGGASDEEGGGEAKTTDTPAKNGRSKKGAASAASAEN